MVACLGACGGVPRVLAVLIISCSRCHDRIAVLWTIQLQTPFRNTVSFDLDARVGDCVFSLEDLVLVALIDQI